MSSPLEQAGAVKEPSEYAALSMDRGITGLWTQRSPLRDADVPYLYGKFYSASRFDSLIDGLNREITAKLTWRRRAGFSPYNSNTFPAMDSFYAFKLLQGGAETIRVMGDGRDGVVYDATAGQKTSIFTKANGAGKTRFQGVGSFLYGSDGIDNWQWIYQQPWAASSGFSVGDTILDSNNNLQMASVATRIPFQVSVAANVLQLDFNGALSFQEQLALPGTQVTLQNFVGASFINGLTLTVQSVTTSILPTRWHLFFSLTHANYGPTADTGYATDPQVWTTGASGGSAPTWGTAVGSTTIDGQLIWTCKGPSVQNMGLDAPTVAPTVAAIPAASALPVWTASTYYWPNSGAFILDSNGNIQQLTTPGTTAAGVPVWSTVVGTTTTDGTAVWTCKGTATRATSHGYNVGDMIAVTWSVTTTLGPFGPPPPYGSQFYVITTYTYKCFFQCVTAGSSSGASTASIAWSPTPGGLIADGTAVWKNVGQQITRTASATASPSTTTTSTGGGGGNNVVTTVTTVAGNVSNTEKVSNSSQVTGTTNGIGFTVSLAGVSGAAEPTWNVALGSPTTDNGLQWVSNGPISAANTGAWLYGFTWKKSFTGEVSNMSPFSSPILLPASSWIGVSGAGSADPYYDTIQIYRTVQGGTIPLFLAEIPAPANGAPWSYQDQATPDTGLNAEIEAPRFQENNPPPVGMTAPFYHLGRLWAIYKNAVICSGGPDTLVGNGNTTFPPVNSFPIQEQPIRLFSTITSAGPGILVWARSNIYIILGEGTASNPFKQAAKYMATCGIQTYDAVSQIGSTFFAFGNTAKIGGNLIGKAFSLDPGAGYVEYGFPIGDQFANVSTGAGGKVPSGVTTGHLYDPASTFVTWAELGSGDTALYVADGAVGWFRYSPVTSPEAGFLWSPRAVVTGGTSAVQGIEVEPGVMQLLVGPATSGPILFRDSTVSQDNGTSFPSYDVKGCIQLCVSGEIGEIAHVHLISAAVGKRPVVGLLFGEILASTAAPFSWYDRTTQEPPNLPPSVSIYSDRYSMLAKGVTPKCLFFQLAMDYGIQNAPDETMMFSVFGAKYAERRQQ